MKTHIKLATLAMALTAATPASATVVTSIQIENAFPTWLQVAELQAIAGGVNVALASAGGVATGSGDYVASTTPALTIDGDTSGNYPNIYHSDSPNAGEFLRITFAQAFDITTLSIFGRSDGASFRDVYNYTLFNGATVVGSGVLDARGETHQASVSLPGGVAGAVPEPATWAMLIGGLGVLGGAMRARRKTSISFA